MWEWVLHLWLVNLFKSQRNLLLWYFWSYLIGWLWSKIWQFFNTFTRKQGRETVTLLRDSPEWDKLRDTVDWGRKWLGDSNAAKTQLVTSDQSNNTGAINVEMDGSALEEKSSFKLLDWLSLLNWIRALINFTAKTTFKKIGVLIRSMRFLSLEVVLYLYNSTIRPCMEYCFHVWIGAPTCYLELLDSYKNGYAGLLFLHLLPLVNYGLIVEM